MPQRSNIHATGLVIDGLGLLIRGPSGFGKSLLALELLQAAETAGVQCALIADDRLDLVVNQNQLIAHAPAQIGGLIELRGRGIVSRPYVSSAPIKLVVELVDHLERMVEQDELATQIEGIDLARCPVPKRQLVDSNHQRLLVHEAIRELKKTA